MVYVFLRVMCKRYFKNNLTKLGGVGVVCQVDEKHVHIQTKASAGRPLEIKK
jgi:hypothetical protein